MNTETFEMYRRPEHLVLPELMSLGLFITSESRLGGVRSDDSAGLEIGFLEQGSVEWWNGEELEEASPSSVLIDPPGDWQGGINAIVHPCSRYWLRFRFPENAPLPGLSRETTEAMQQGFESINRHFLPASPDLGVLFANLLQEQREPTDHSEDLSRAYFHQILIQVLRTYRAISNRQMSQKVIAAQNYIDGNFREKIKMDAISSEIGCSPGYFHEIFHRETGFTPLNYQNRMRIAEAKRLLIQSDQSVTEIGLGIGFSSSQYFSTTFRRIVGLTPLDYRKIRSSGRRP